MPEFSQRGLAGHDDHGPQIDKTRKAKLPSNPEDELEEVEYESIQGDGDRAGGDSSGSKDDDGDDDDGSEDANEEVARLMTMTTKRRKRTTRRKKKRRRAWKGVARRVSSSQPLQRPEPGGGDALSSRSR